MYRPLIIINALESLGGATLSLTFFPSLLPGLGGNIVNLIDEIDDVEEYVSTETRTETDADKARDRRLLKALLNGDAISAVYDHSHFERSEKKMDKVARQRLENGAQQIVDGVDFASSILFLIALTAK